MPFTAEQLSYGGLSQLDFYMKDKVEDLYNTERPLLKALRAHKKNFPGGNQYIVDKLRKTNDSNFQWFGPDDQVTYNRKRTLAEAKFPWGSAHDGFGLTEEELAANFITVTDDRSATPTTDEKWRLVNLITENTATLVEGFGEKMDYHLHLDGTQDADAIVGLDGTIKIDPTSGTLGTIDQSIAGNAYFRNHVSLDVAKANLKVEMGRMWRKCIRVGGFRPNLILAGTTAIEIYEEIADTTINRQMTISGNGKASAMDIAVNEINYKGVPIIWDPVFETLDADLSPTDEWESRIYFLNTNFLKLRPMEGQDMKTRRPPRAYDRYTHYWGLTWRGGLTTNRPSCMAVLTVTGS